MLLSWFKVVYPRLVRSRLSSPFFRPSPSFSLRSPPSRTLPRLRRRLATSLLIPNFLLRYSPPLAHLPARSRGLEDGSLRFLLFPSFPSLLSLISLLLALYSSLLFSFLFFSFLLFSSLFFSFLLFLLEGDTTKRERRDFNLPNFSNVIRLSEHEKKP